MSANTGIAWTSCTFNPWWGCAKVSPGCDNCYAERDAARFSPGIPMWGVGGPNGVGRRVFGDKHWNEPRKWNRQLQEAHAQHVGGVGPEPAPVRVFCASMADVFDNHETANELRPRLWQLIRDTPYLDWQILTKRIGNAMRMLPDDWGNGYANAWLGSSVVNQDEADRDIPKLLQTPAVVRFLSCEPLLEPIDVSGWVHGQVCATCRAFQARPGPCICGSRVSKRGLHWIIVGGESGPKARPFNLQWPRDIIAQCKAASVPVFMKQCGAKPYLHSEQNIDERRPGFSMRVMSLHIDKTIAFNDRAGADPLEWPSDLRVQQFPEARVAA